MSITKKLREEIDAVCPPDDRPRRVLRAPVVLEDDGEAVKPPPIRANYGRTNGDPTTRERVLAIVREHGPIAQREVYHRLVRAVGDMPSLRSRVSAELLTLEEHGLAQRCRPPKDVDQQQVWWEVIE